MVKFVPKTAYCKAVSKEPPVIIMIVTATAVPVIIETIFNRVLSPFIKYYGIKLRPKAIEGPKTKE